MTGFWMNLRNQYNVVALEKGWPAMGFCSHVQTGPGQMGYTTITCTVKDSLSKTYGKMPDSGASTQIIMEYEYLMDTFANNTVFDPACIDESTTD